MANKQTAAVSNTPTTQPVYRLRYEGAAEQVFTRYSVFNKALVSAMRAGKSVTADIAQAKVSKQIVLSA
jgi:hypothetical protein